MTTQKAPRPAPAAAIVAPGQSPFAALAAMGAKFVADAPEEPAIDWAQPQAVGHGIFAQLTDGMLIMAVPVTDAARKKARPSKEGKLCLLANSGGFKALEGLGLKLSLMVGFPNPAAPRKGIGSK